MEPTQRDRDSLRESQQKLRAQAEFIIGSLVEHKIQDPAKYKTLSRQEQGLAKDARPKLSKIHYKSRYLSSETGDITQEKTAKSTEMTPKPQTNGLPLSPEEVQANLWLNMDRVEFDKLEWMSEKAEKEYQEKLKATTHFDNQGKAVQLSDNTQLEDVHDIGSLVKLLDSTFQPQITYALNVVTKIAARATIGLYDSVFDENIHEVLIKECLLRVRHHLDSANETICQSALKCLRALLCNTQVDEVFLDKLFPLKSDEADVTMWLMTDQENFGPDMKDSECVALDVIMALFGRTDFLKRIKYLLCTKVEPEFRHTYHECTLDILIRFARYSRGMSWILNSNEFPKLLVNLFQPADIVRKGKPEQMLALRSLKFLRISAQASNELRQVNCQPGGKDLKLPSSLVETITTYYHIDCVQDENEMPNDLLFRIQIETLRLMKSLSTMRQFANHVYSVMAMNHTILVKRVKGLTDLSAIQEIKSPSSLDWQYAAALIDLMSSMIEHEKYQTGDHLLQGLWDDFIRVKTMQWFNEIIGERVIPHQDVSITLAVAFQQFERRKHDRHTLQLYDLLLDKTTMPREPSNNASLAFYRRLVREATADSQLGSFLRTSGCLRDPVMLPSYGCMNLNTSDKYEYKLNSAVSLHTPYILLEVYFKVLQSANTRYEELMQYYLNNVDLVRYMRSAACYYKYPLHYESLVQKSTLAQQEIRILSNACLSVSHYCIGDTDAYGEELPAKETKAMASTRAECYSQLLLDTISVIGLINPEVMHMAQLREKLLEKIVLNEVMQARLVRESRFRRTSDWSSYQGCHIESMNRKLDPEAPPGSLGVAREPVDSLYLRPVFLNCEQPNRFWIFQPFIEYHKDKMDDDKAAQEGRWFTSNISHDMRGRPLPTNCTDTEVVSCLLKFNALILHHSPSYFQLAVKPNIEEHLCLLGSVFLHDNLFLDKAISRPLAYNLEILLTEGLCQGVDRVFSDASHKIMTLNMTLMDFFSKIVDQYEAASYCDVVFTNFLLLFITPKCDKAFRRILFSDKVETCLSQISIGHEEVWIPRELITRDKEPDQEIRTLILRSAAYTVRSSYLDYYRRHHTSAS